MMRLLLTSTLLALATTSVMAAETFPMKGSMSGKSSAELHEVSETHLVIHQVASVDKLDFGGGTPFDGIPGDCFGAIEIINGMPNGGGVCVWDDGAGNKLVTDWHVTGMTPEQASTGTWNITGGTGRFEGASGGGHYVSATDMQTGTTTLDATGAATMP